MHKFFTRLNVIFFFYLSVLLTMGIACWGTTLLFKTPNVPVKMHVHEIEDFRIVQSPYLSGERAVIFFDIDADLTPLWNWNVKQLFLWVIAEYQTPSTVENHFVVWDKILRDRSEYKLLLTKERTKYDLLDLGKELKGVKVKFILHWEVMPMIGMLSTGRSPSEYEFTLPTSNTGGRGRAIRA